MIASPVRLFLLPVIGGFLTLLGCGTYRNATAYFNTYYNASQLYDQAVTEMLKTPQTARDSNYFAPYKLTQPVVTKFEKVIEKGSRVIQFHGESGYVEDAIMMIGKAYLYQNETESAAGKFRELLDNFPRSDHRAEARLWLAKALYQGKNDEEALTAAKELAAPNAEGDETEIPGDILLEITMLEAQIYADRGEFVQAAGALGRSEAIEGDGELKAIAQYQLGFVYEKTGDYARAADAYALVKEYSPTPTMSFNARLRQGVMLSMAGRPDEALESFDDLIQWPLKPDQSALVDLEIANAYWARGDSAAAFTLYAIIDSTYKKTDAGARAAFQRGVIFEKEYRKLPLARKFYEKAKTEFAASYVTPLALERFTALDRYLKTRERLAKDDSTLQALLNPDTGKAGDSTRAGKPAPADTAGGAAGLADDAGDEAEAEAIRAERNDRRPPQLTSNENLSMRAIRSRPRHLVPDPEDPEDPAGAGGEGSAPESPAPGLAGKADGGGGKKPTAAGTQAKAPQGPAKAEDLVKRIAEGKLELGGIFLLDLALPDSALLYYQKLVGDHPESPLVPKALYAMSEVYRISSDTPAVDSLYDILLQRHPDTEYAGQVRKLRGLDTAVAVETDEAIRYAKAEAALFGGDPDLALSEFKALSAESGDTTITPKACYAVGWIYENVRIDLDSADAWYKKLIKEFPASAYAVSAEPRVAVRGDTSKLKQYVKFKKIEAIPKPEKKALGQVPKQPIPGRANEFGQPGNINRPPVDPDDDEYFNPGEDEDEEEADPDAEAEDPDEEPPEDDDPGRPEGRQFPQSASAGFRP